MTVMLLTEHNLEFVSLKGDCTGSRESTHVNIAHCWKSHVVAHVALRTARLQAGVVAFLKAVGLKLTEKLSSQRYLALLFNCIIIFSSR